jgi:nucleotide-binding universal stress UspA family protein
MPLLQIAEEVFVVLIDQPLRVAGQDMRPGDDIVTHLSHHGVTSKLARVASGQMKTFEAVLAEAVKNDAQLIVMGAHEGGAFMQLFKENVARQALAASPLPLFLAS